jgi:hypothetical protein
MKNVTFSPCSDLQNKQLIWAMYSKGQYLGFSSATLIAGKYAEKYADDVKVRTFS